jgi:hopanoid-associated phosphorylase
LTQVIGVVAAMAAEARFLGRLRPRTDGLFTLDDGAVVSISGIGCVAASAGARALVAGGATSLMSWGMAGGLDPTLRPGNLLLPDAVSLPDGSVFPTNPQWRERLSSLLAAAVRGTILTTPVAVDSVGEKAALFSRTGAVAVDMESAAIAKVAADRGLPFVAVRVIVDTARDVLPKAVVAASGAGQVNLPRLIRGLLRSPAEVLPLIRLARRYAAAKKSLIVIAARIRHHE